MTPQEYIDRERKRARLNFRWAVGRNDAPAMNRLAERLQALDELERGQRPTATRDKVVLCKDCQFWQGNNGGYPHPECRWGHDETPDEDDYCSFAERLSD